MSFTFTEQAAKDLAYWRENNPAMVSRIKAILESIHSSPFSGIGIGIGKPEPLKHDLMSMT